MTNCILDSQKFYNPKVFLQNKIGFSMKFDLEKEPEALKLHSFEAYVRKVGLRINIKMQKGEVI